MIIFLRRLLQILGLLVTLSRLVFASYHPSDTFAMVNQSAHFNCSTKYTSQGIFWYHYPLGHGDSQVGEVVFRRGSFYGNYRNDFGMIEVNNSHVDGTYFCNLVIQFARNIFAGKYECRDRDGFGDIFSAQLTVIDKSPRCTSNSNKGEAVKMSICGLERDQAELSCSVNFHGNIPPTLNYTYSKQPEGIVDVSPRSTANEVTYRAILKAEHNLDNTFITCRVMQLIDEVSCNFTLRVLFAQNSTANVDLVIGNGNEANCSLNTSSSSCSYEWKGYDGKNSETVSNSVALKPNNSGIYRCEANCYLLDKMCRVFGTIINASEPLTMSIKTTDGVPKTSDFATVGIVVGVIVTAVGLILVVICIFKKRQMVELSTVEHALTQAESSTVPFNRPDDPEESLCQTVETRLTSRSTLTLRAADSKNSGKAIAGITFLMNELFVVFEHSPIVEVFHSVPAPFEPHRSFVVAQLDNPLDIASSSIKDCLFVYCFGNIFVVDRYGRILISWETDNEKGSLSIAMDSNVILSLFNIGLLIEYSVDGQILHRIKLPSGILPFHALKVTDNTFCISFVRGNSHGVCFINRDGEVTYAGSTLLEFPRYLSLTVHGDYLIVDSKNSRILLFDNTLEGDEILSSEDGLSRPVKICLDHSTDQLFVADNGDRCPRIMIFSIK